MLKLFYNLTIGLKLFQNLEVLKWITVYLLYFYQVLRGRSYA